MAKKITKSQRIGLIGEAQFALWANSNNLIANKCEHDYGFDYDCQIIEENIVSSRFLRVQCKASESKLGSSYAKIDKNDAALYLSSNELVCLVGIDITTGTIFPKIIDEDFAERLIIFSTSNKTELNILYSDLNDNVGFIEKLKKACKSHYIEKIKLKVLKKITGKTLELKREITDDQVNLILNTGYLSEIIEPNEIFNNILNKKPEELLNRDLFTAIKLCNMTADNYQISGCLGEYVVIGSKKNCAITLGISYPYKGNKCIRLKSGLCLTISQSLDRKKQRKCRMNIEKSPFSIIDCLDDYYAFESIIANQIMIASNHELVNKQSLEGLNVPFKFMEGIIKAHERGFISFAGVSLKSIDKREEHATLAFVVNLILHDNLIGVLNGFQMAWVSEDGDIVRVPTTKTMRKGIIPVGFSIGNSTYVVFITCTYEDIVGIDGVVIGINPIDKLGIRFEEHNELGKLPYPEMWAYPNMSPVLQQYVEIPDFTELQPRKFNLEELPA